MRNAPLPALGPVDAKLLRVIAKLLAMPPAPPLSPEERASMAAEREQARLDAERRVHNALPPVVDPDTDMRLEVIEELVAEGKARHVAADLTNTRVKLHAQAKRLGVL